MMKVYLRILCLLIFGVLLATVFTACGGGRTETPTEQPTVTPEETTPMTDPSAETQPQEPVVTSEETTPVTDPSGETQPPSDEADPALPVFQTGELTLPELAELFPDFKEMESWEHHAAEHIELYAEAEEFRGTTMPYAHILSEEFGGGRIIHTPCETPAQGWDHTYSLSYTVNAPKQGTYRMVVLASDLEKEYTSDFFVEINGSRALTAAQSYTILEHFPAKFDANLLKVMDLGTVTLTEGENTITFTIDNVDSQNSWNRLSFFMDYFKLTYIDDSQIDMGCSVSYAVAPEGEDSEALLAAQTVHVFDCRYPLCLTASVSAKEGSVAYTVTDYYGHTLYEGNTSVSEAGQVTLTRTVKNHPTGYFTLTVGDQSCRYVVLNAFNEKTPEDSPFAMDYAAYYLVKDPANTFAIATAARMAGVTWVRDRADWRTYEAIKGQYDFTSTEAVYRAIDKAGLKNLVMLCSAPAWATDPLKPNGMAGGFLPAQQDIYHTTKAMVTYYKGIVDAWELWNESDHGFALETAEQFAAWYKAAALGVYDADPNAIISFGGFCQPNENIDYVHLALLNDVLDYSSVFNYHAHTPQGTSIPDFSRFAMVAGTFGTLNHYNTQNKPIWLTEAGMKIMTSTPSEKNLKDQAPYIVTSAVQSLSMGTDKHFWFVLAPYIENAGDFGTFGPDLQPYPTLAAESTMTHVLGKGQYLGELYDLPKGAYGYVFFTGSRAASVLWAGENTAYTFATEQAVIVTNLMGNQMLVKPENGTVTIEIGVDPVFVTYSIAPAYQNKQFEIVKPAPLQLDLGQRVIIYPEFEGYNINDGVTKQQGHKISDATKVILHVVNFNQAEVRGEIEAFLPGFTVTGHENEITIPAMDKVTLTLTLQKTTEEDVDAYLSFTGEFNGEKTSRSTAHVYTDTPAKDGTARFSTVREGKEYDVKALANVGIKWGRKEGTGVAYVNGQKITTVTYEDNELSMDLSALSEGKHTVTAGIVTPTGDLIYKIFYVTYQNGVVTFDMG